MTTKITKELITAGDAIFTVELPPLGPAPHYTFRVQKVEASLRYPESFFVKMLTGPDNTGDYSYIGKLNPGTGAVEITRKSKLAADSFPVKLLNRILARVWASEHAAFEAHGYVLHHEGRCCRCRRRLTTPESIEAGIGPECRKMMPGVAEPAIVAEPVRMVCSNTLFAGRLADGRSVTTVPAVRDDYLCQVCCHVREDHGTWSPEITGSESAGNVCPSCLIEHEATGLTGDALRRAVGSLKFGRMDEGSVGLLEHCRRESGLPDGPELRNYVRRHYVDDGLEG